MQFRAWQITADAFDFVWRERRAAVRFGTVSLAIAIAASLIMEALGANRPAADRADMSQQAALAVLVLGLMQAVVYLPLTVTWYRMVVFGEAEARRRPLFALGRLEWRLFGWQILVLLVLGAVGAVGIGIIGAVYVGLDAIGQNAAATVAGIVLGLGLVVAILWAATRLALVFVLVAVEQPVSFKASWRMTDGSSWRLLGAMGLVSLAAAVCGLVFQLIAFVIGAVAAMVTGGTAGQIVPYVAAVGQSVIALVVFLALATVFGFVYRMLTNTVTPATASS